MSTLSDVQVLVESTPSDPELIPEILPSEAHIAIGMFTSDLVELFTRAASVAQTKEIIPGTSMALLEAVPATEGTVSHVQVSASDGQQWSSTISEAKVKIFRAGSALMPAKKILDILKLAPHKATKITAIGSRVLIQSGQVRWSVEIPVGNSLSSTPQALEVDTYQIPAGALSIGLRAVQAALGTSRARGSFMQVHVELGSLTATDGPRLHRIKVPGLDESITTDIPLFAVSQVLSMLDSVDDGADIDFGGNERRILFRIGTHTLISQRLIEPFPDVESLILAPTFSNERALTVDREPLLAVIKRVRINSDPDHSGVTLSVTKNADGAGWSLSVSARDNFGNASQEALPCHWSGKSSHDLTVNHVLLTDMIRVLDDSTVIMRVGPDTKTNRTPILIESGNFTGVLAQVRTDWSG